jgi:putative ABC transport system permease protein
MAASRGGAPVIGRTDNGSASVGSTSTADGAPASAATNHGRRRDRSARARTGTWLLAIRDLQWRRRRFGIAIAGTGLVFALTLLISGIAASFRAEVGRTIHAIGADVWIVREGITGPFTALSLMPEATTDIVRATPGVRSASPLIVMHHVVRAPRSEDVNLYGYRIGGMGAPPVAQGRPVRRGGEAVADETLGFDIGTVVDIAGHRLQIVGLTKGLTVTAGTPNVYVAIGDAQTIAFEGRALANAVVTKGNPKSAPPGFQLMSNAQVRTDLFRPLQNPVATIDMVQLMLWVVAVNIIGAVVYLSALERVRDFAVLKATGYSSRSLLAGLAVQSVTVSIGAVAFALVLARALAPLFPMTVELELRGMIILPIVGVAVGLLASLFGVRHAGSVDPALAFGGP